MVATSVHLVSDIGECRGFTGFFPLIPSLTYVHIIFNFCWHSKYKIYFICQMCSDTRRSIHAIAKWRNYCKGSKTGRLKNVPFLLFFLWFFYCWFSNDLKSVHLKQIAFSHAFSSWSMFIVCWVVLLHHSSISDDILMVS